MTHKPTGLQEMLPLSPLQQGMLFHALLDNNGPDVYTVQWGIHLEGSLDPVAMRAAGQALLDRHANLRAGYRYVKSGNAVAVIPHRVELPWHEVDLSGLDPAERATELARCSTECRDRRFDLANPPLIRFMLVRLGSEHHHLSITYHHILLDGWSIPLVREELFGHYARRGEISGQAPATPYRDYLAWLAAQDRPAAETAWRQALAGLEEPTLVAGADQHRPPLAPDRVTTPLPEGLTTALTRQARQRGVTLNTVVQTAWAILLGRLTGHDDVTFGVTVSGRSAELAGMETMVGLFINTVPVRVRLRPWEPIAEVLTRVQTEQTELLAYHHLGLADIQRLAGVSPLFDTLVVYENIPTGSRLADPACGLRIPDEELYTVTHYPIAVVAHPGPSLTLELFYRPDLFDQSTAEAMTTRLVRILESIAADPGQPIGRIDILTAAERHQVLVEWNDTAHTLPEATFTELFAAQAARTPHATAIVFESTEVTYGQLNAEANRLARVLIDRGVGAERIVALALPRSTEMIVAVLAVLKTGGAYLPLDPDHPAERIAFMVDDANPVMIVTTAAIASSLPDSSVSRHLIFGDHDVRVTWEGSDGADLTDVERAGPLPIGAAAYVLYTSGSTGRPKGVVVSHDGVSSLVATAVDRLGVGPDSRVLQFASISFDVAFWELCMALLVGGRLVIIPEDRRVAGPALADYVREHAVTHMVLPPSLIATLPEDCALPAGATLLVGTERVPPQLISRWSTSLRLFAAYGLTETTVNSTLWPAGPEWADQSVPIGRPDPGTQVYVLDTALNPVPVGVTGELYVVGDGLARGYLGRHGLTAERFVADPYGPPGGRMYRTGDMARYQPDGCVEFLGRNDGQVKVRGFRVELGEIETVLSQHPQVTHAAVIVDDPDVSGTQRLVGYVVPAPVQTPQIDALAPRLREHLKQRLPGHMVPAALVMVDQLPLTVNGKLDVKALPTPGPIPATPGRAPRSPQEQVVCELFAKVLGLDRVGVDDDFFDLGGYSLTAARVIVQLSRTLDVDVPLAELFQRPTAASLTAAVIALQRGEQPPAERSPDDAHEWDSALPTYDNLPPRPRRPETHVLLTGSTGFFGAYLLHELLSQTQCRVTCLVRAQDAPRAWERLHTNLEKYGLWGTSHRQRVSVVVGDLARPRLGLSLAEYERLAAEIDAIYHNAAQVRGLFSHEQFRGVNEGGTLELLRLATTSWLKTFHYVSTTDVATLEQSGQDTSESGYAESKWRAERLVTAAMSYGVPAAVYRTPRLAGDSRTGRSNDHDVMFRVLRWILELSTAPDIDVAETWIPVDEAARLLVSVARRHHDSSHFVLTTQRKVRLAHVLDTARHCGYQVDVKPVHEWEQDFKVRSPEEYQVMSSIFEGVWGDRRTDAEKKVSSVDREPTSEDFTSIVAHGVNEGMLQLYLSSLRQLPTTVPHDSP
ncbi:MAG: non-ribosomal peptide synthetase [Pseudonocardia sp.]